MALTRAMTVWPSTTSAAARRSSMRPLVQEPMKTRSMAISVDLRAGRRGPYRRASGHRGALGLVAGFAGSGTVPVIGDHILGARAPSDDRRQVAGVEPHLAVEMRRLRRAAGSPSSAAPRPRRRPSARAAGPSDRRRSSRPARSCRRARRPRSTCCRPSCGLPSKARGSPRRHIR